MTNKDAKQRLRQLYGQGGMVRMLLDHFAKRRRSSHFTVDALVALVRKLRIDGSRAEVVAFLKALDEIGVGRFVVGRRGHESRFRWISSMSSVGKVAKGEADQLAGLEPDDVEDGDDEYEVEQSGSPRANDEASRGMVPHVYALRSGLFVTLPLPADLTAAEAERLATYIRTLPFGDANHK